LHATEPQGRLGQVPAAALVRDLVDNIGVYMVDSIAQERAIRQGTVIGRAAMSLTTKSVSNGKETHEALCS
jgi:hypothetical protein